MIQDDVMDVMDVMDVRFIMDADSDPNRKCTLTSSSVEGVCTKCSHSEFHYMRKESVLYGRKTDVS